MIYRKCPILLLLLCISVYVFGQTEHAIDIQKRNAQMGFNDTIDRLADDFVEAYVVVADPGGHLYSSLGHASYHLKCPVFDLDYYFTMEGEDEKDAVWRFLKGDLKMGMLRIPAEEFLAPYARENRGVTDWKLNLSPKQKQYLWAVLDKKVKEWQDLPYDFYRRGCVIAMVDVMNEVVGGENIHYKKQWPEKFRGTIREMGCEMLEGNAAWDLFFMFFLVGDDIDKMMPNERKIVFPKDLVSVWKNAVIGGKKVLENNAKEVLPSIKRGKGTWCTPLLVSIGLCIAALLSLCTIYIKKTWTRYCGVIIDYTILGIVAAVGVFMTYLLLLSNLPCTNWNWLYIAFNPLPAICWQWRRYWALPYAVLMMMWIAAIICAPHLLALSAHLALIGAFVIVLVKEYLKTKYINQ